jgi:hypothetical protein
MAHLEKNINQQLTQAVQLALADDWDGAHTIAQDYANPIANWLHAVLHKIEGDAWNSRYWYNQTTSKHYEDYADAKAELIAIALALTNTEA